MTEISATNGCYLRCSGDTEAEAFTRVGLEIVSNDKAKVGLLGWIPVDSRRYAVPISGLCKASRTRGGQRFLFLISAYDPIYHSSSADKDRFYQRLHDLIKTAQNRHCHFSRGLKRQDR